MSRNINAYYDDIEMLKKLKIGDRVKYISKEGVVKTGIIVKFKKYYGNYGNIYEHRRYHNYTSVTILLDNSKKHISVSPRNLTFV